MTGGMIANGTAASCTQNDTSSTPIPTNSKMATTTTTTTTTTTRSTTKKMGSVTVLANAFVPNSVRGTLNDVPGVTYPAVSSLPSLLPSAQILRQSLCPHLPLVPVPNGRSHGIIAVPVRFMPLHDLHYALWFRQQQLSSSSSSSSSIPRGEGSATAPRDETELAYQAIHENPGTDMEGYCAALEGLVMKERCELLNRYERYTQYNASIRLVRSRGDGTKTGTFIIKGITGSRPTIDVGDSVVLRTTQGIEFRKSLPIQKPTSSKFSRSDYHVVELHCQCLSIQRNNADGNDVVSCTWISDLLSNRLFTLENSMPTLHIRIVPRTDHMQRCLTAISWLRTWPTIFFAKLLFPTEAPSLAPLDDHIELPFTKDLNTQQLSFVRAVVQRTLQPEFEFVRPPLVLTGKCKRLFFPFFGEEYLPVFVANVFR